MLWINVQRIARYGLIGFIRNGFISLAAVLVMTITLFVAALLLIGGAALNSTLHALTNKVDVTVYFTTSATNDQIQELQKNLTALPEVASVVPVSRDQAIAQFRERHKNDQLTIQALDALESNPLGASLEIRAKQTSQYESIAKYLEVQQASQTGAGAAIEKINFFQNKTAIDRLTNIIETSNRVGVAVAIILGVASLLIVFNTIRLAIYTARDEIGVMNLVGASHWYVRGPFMIGGVLYGITSALIVLIILYPLLAWLGPGSEQFLGVFNVFTYYVDSFAFLFVAIMGSGIALGSVSSYLAVRRYLNA